MNIFKIQKTHFRNVLIMVCCNDAMFCEYLTFKLQRTTSFISLFADVSFCPVRLTRLYLQRLGLEYNKPDFVGFMVPRVRCSKAGEQTAEAHQRLSYTTAAEDFKLLLRTVGIPPKHYTEHSGKRGAATVAADMGMSTDDLQRMGGWASRKMAAKYTDLSVTKRIRLAENLHGGAAPSFHDD